MFRVGQNHIYTVCIRYFWQENHQIYVHIQCIYTVPANPNYVGVYVPKGFLAPNRHHCLDGTAALVKTIPQNNRCSFAILFHRCYVAPLFAISFHRCYVAPFLAILFHQCSVADSKAWPLSLAMIAIIIVGVLSKCVE